VIALFEEKRPSPIETSYANICLAFLRKGTKISVRTENLWGGNRILNFQRRNKIIY
jgi:hypothetical protein